VALRPNLSIGLPFSVVNNLCLVQFLPVGLDGQHLVTIPFIKNKKSCRKRVTRTTYNEAVSDASV
jgi:hypothetical protein